MSRQSRQSRQNRIDRDAAAEILSISQRTLDRYVKNKRLTSRKANGRVWLNREDVLRFKKEREEAGVITSTRHKHDIKIDLNDGIITHRQSRQTPVDPLSTLSTSKIQNDIIEEINTKVLHSDKNEDPALINTVVQSIDDVVKALLQPQKAPPNPQDLTALQTNAQQFTYYYSEGIYQKLYDEIKEEHRHQQKRIEAANYRVGQLEAQLGAMVPLLEHRKQKEQFKKLESGLKTEIRKREMQLKKARSIVYTEKLNKYIFAGLVFLLLLLQPIIWLLQN